MKHYSSITDLILDNGFQVAGWGDQFIRELPNRTQYIQFSRLAGHTVESFERWMKEINFLKSESEEKPTTLEDVYSISFI